jgi:phenylalanyl-tRNA synthetase alpha chain
MHDTFWLTDGRLPRTHTSAYQIPAMQGRTPPVRFVVPGRAFRNEATDATHEIMFMNFEGIAIDRNVSLAHLKGTLLRFMREVYGADADVRFVPSYFPFVEPGLEIYTKIKGRWVEMGGAGTIHPRVLTNMGVDQTKYQGFAFGMGIDRLVMMKYGVEDVRHLYSGNLRFLGQFRLTDQV